MREITSRTETVASGDTNEKVVYITITTKTKDDMISKYNFTSKQQEALDTLLRQDRVRIKKQNSDWRFFSHTLLKFWCILIFADIVNALLCLLFPFSCPLF